MWKFTFVLLESRFPLLTLTLFLDEEVLSEITQGGEIDLDKWNDVREGLLRRLDQVRYFRPLLQFPSQIL